MKNVKVLYSLVLLGLLSSYGYVSTSYSEKADVLLALDQKKPVEPHHEKAYGKLSDKNKEAFKTLPKEDKNEVVKSDSVGEDHQKKMVDILNQDQVQHNQKMKAKWDKNKSKEIKPLPKAKKSKKESKGDIFYEVEGESPGVAAIGRALSKTSTHEDTESALAVGRVLRKRG